MEKNYREFYWKRLDNAAKGFSAISDKNNTNVYRISVRLTLPVEQGLLQRALEKTLEEIPSFNVRQHKGFFWYYLESNFQKPVVREEATFPCLRIESGQNNGFLFRVTYFGNKINLEVFHSLTDGTGALVFLKRLLYHYLSLRFPGESLEECEIFDEKCHPREYEEDSFLKNYSRETQKKGHTAKPAYRIRGIPLEKKVTRVITGAMPVSQVIRLAKESGVTVTEYLTAVLLLAIHESAPIRSRKDRPIVLCIPVNLRGYYESHTLSNFFSYLNIGIPFAPKPRFEEILKQVQQQFERELKRERIEEKLRYNVEAEQNLAIRFVPLFIKRIGLKIIHKRGERGQSCALSNLGVLQLPESLRPFVERFEILVSTSSIKPIKAGVISYNGTMSFTFTSAILNTDIQQYFFSFLSGKGVEVEIISNEI